MTEPIIARARNIYEQQRHNQRMTWLLLVAFVILIAIAGIGIDVFLNIGSVARFILLPFVILMVISGIRNFKKRADNGLWGKPKAFAEDDSDLNFILWSLCLVIIPILLFISIPIYLFDPHLFEHFFSQHFDIPILRYLPIGTTLAVIIGIVSILTSLRWGTNSVLWSVRASKFDESADYENRLINIVREMSLAAGMPSPPSVYIVKDSDPNAFTVGVNPTDSVIVVTTGLLLMLDRNELQGVIAHEMSHIRNSDTRLMTVITVLFGAVLLLSEWMKKSALFGGSIGSRIPVVSWVLRGILFVGWIITLLFAPLIARIIAMAVSRQREYMADAGGAELTRNPKALAGALLKIENAIEPTASFHKGIAHLCVVDPLGKAVNEKEGFWAELFSTHPPMKKRIMLLNSMAYIKKTGIKNAT